MKSRQDKNRKALKRGEYVKTSGYYEYRWREKAGINEETGKMMYKQRSVTARSLDDLRELEKQIIKDENDGLHPRQQTNLNTYVDMYFKVKKGLKSNTKANYQYMYDKFVRNSRIGTMPLQKLTKYDLVAFYTGLVDKQMLSVSACVTLQNVIGPAIEIAIDSGILIRRNVSLGALKELKKQEQIKKADDRARNGHKMQSLTLAEQKRFLEVIKDKWYEPVFTIALLTGMRCGELCGLTEDCIDYKNNVIHVRQNLVYFKKADGHCGLELHAVKTVAGNRDLPLNDKIKEMLDKQKKFMDPKWADFEVDGVKGFLFMTKEGRPHRQDTLNRCLRRIVRNANDEVNDVNGIVELPQVHMHIFRKTYATNLCRSGAGLERIAKLCGHGDLTVCNNIYIAAMADIAADTDAAMIKALNDADIISSGETAKKSAK